MKAKIAFHMVEKVHKNTDPLEQLKNLLLTSACQLSVKTGETLMRRLSESTGGILMRHAC